MSDRIELVETVRTALQDQRGVVHARASDCRRAVELLARLRSVDAFDVDAIIADCLSRVPNRDVTVTQARAAYLSIPSDGSMEAFPGSPDPFSAQQHETVVKRSRSGRNVPTIVRHGVATVIGDNVPKSDDWHVSADGVTVFDRADIALALEPDSEHGKVRQMVCGRNVIDIGRATQAIYGASIPTLIGTEVIAPSEGIRHDRSDTCHVSSGHAGLSGWADDTEVDRFAAHGAVYGAHTAIADVMSDGTGDRFSYGATSIRDAHVTRARLTLVPRASERKMATDSELLAAHHDAGRIFIGHKSVARGPLVASKQRLSAQASAIAKSASTMAATIDELPTSADAWQLLAEHLNRGERLVITSRDTVVTLTRSKKSGTYSGNVKHAGNVTRINACRTTLAIGRKLALVA